MQELAPGVFVETGLRLVNVAAILTRDGFVLIDTPPYPDDARLWRQQLTEIAPLPVLAIINTDSHRDRVLGNSWFNPRAIVAHDDTIAQIKSLSAAFLDNTVDALIQTPVDRERFSGAELRVPTVGFSYRMQLRYGGQTIPLLSMPGPNAGNLWVHLPEQRLVFTGDSLVVDQHPYITSLCTKLWLENLTNLRRARFAADVIVPGRGPLTGKDATEPISYYLRLARRRVYSLYRAGRPRADTSTLVPELLELFPYDAADLENVQRRIKSGLDRIYEEFKLNDRGNDNPPR